MPLRDPKHLAFIRTLPCLKCGCFWSQACHIRKFGDGGTGMKPGDDRTIPLCFRCHHDQHQHGEVRFFSDIWAAIDLAKYLYEITGNETEAIMAIIEKRGELFR